MDGVSLSLEAITDRFLSELLGCERPPLPPAAAPLPADDPSLRDTLLDDLDLGPACTCGEDTTGGRGGV